MQNFWQDVKYGARVLAKNPAFTIIAIVTLALGIGVNSAVFSVVNGVLLSPLSFPHSEQLLALFESGDKFDRSSISYPNFLDWQKRNNTLDKIAVFRQDSFNITGSGESELVSVNMVSSDFFPLLGVKPVLGRVFTPDDDHLGAAKTVMLMEGFWKRKFGGRPDIVGQNITLSGETYQVIGIVPQNFALYFGNYDREGRIFTPVGVFDDGLFHTHRDIHEGMNAVARMKPGVTVAAAKADMNRVAAELSAEYPEDKKAGIWTGSLKEEEVGNVRSFLLVLLGSVFFVMLIACVNVANLQLARATSRAKEFAVRTALGATASRVVRQLLVESLLLAGIGGALGLLIAWQGTELALKVLPEALPRAENVGLDWRVVLFTLGVSVLAGVVFGLAPALKTLQPDVQKTLRESGRGGCSTKHRAQAVFVAVEMALALVLLVGAGLMIRSLVDLWRVNPGYNPKNAADFSVMLSAADGATPDRYRQSLVNARDQLAALPGVVSVSVTNGSLPMQGDNELPFWIDGRPKPATTAEMEDCLFYFTDSHYPQAMGITLLSGRFLQPTDTILAPVVAVVDENFAKKYWPGENPVGKYINIGILNSHVQIVGVAGHVKHWGLDGDTNATIQTQLYMSTQQIPDQFLTGPPQARFVVRTAAAPLAMANTWKSTLQKMNSEYVMYGTVSLEEVIERSMASRRFSMILLAVFAVLALLLSCVGIFGVVSYVVTQRTHEIGIRVALGAQRSDVMKLMLGEGMQMALAGVAVGLVASFFLTRLLSTLLYGVSATDPVTFLAVACVLSSVALAACYIPTRRAMRVDPMVALRYE